jgi:hypothetical protein
MIKFKCNNCGMEIAVDDEYAGKRGRCSHCKAINDIPIPAGSPPPREPVAASPSKSHANFDTKLPIPAAQIDMLVNAVRPSLSQKLFVAVEKIGYLVGVYGFLALAVLALVAAMILASSDIPVRPRWSRSPMSPTVTTLVIMAFLMLVAQYVLAKMRSASLSIVRTSPSSISSRNLLDCLAVLMLLGSVAILVRAIVNSTDARDVKSVLTILVDGLLYSVLLVLTASLALNPETLNISVKPRGSAGTEALGFVSFVVKLGIRAAPLVIGGMIVVVAINLIKIIIVSIDINSGLPLVAFAAATCTRMIILTLGYLLLYVICLFYHLYVDAVRALFKIRDNTTPNE